jgi:DnaA family protein
VQQLKKAVAAEPEERFIYIWGAAGSGKSHLLKAAARATVQAGEKACYLAGGEAHLDSAELAGSGLVAVDDVNGLDAKNQVELFKLYNLLRESGRGMLLASGPVPPAQLPLRRDLATRLGWGLVYQIQMLSEAERKNALKEHARERGMHLSAEMVDYLLHHGRRDLPSLLAVIEALDRYSLETRRPVTLALLKELGPALD